MIYESFTSSCACNKTDATVVAAAVTTGKSTSGAATSMCLFRIRFTKMREAEYLYYEHARIEYDDLDGASYEADGKSLAVEESVQTKIIKLV